MDIIQAIILGVAQGLTEFLPVSSSGHLVLLQKIFGINNPPIFFDTMVHGATLIAVVFYLRKDLMEILMNLKKNMRLIWLIILGTLPAVIFAVVFKDLIEKSFNSLFWLSICFFITAVLLFIAMRVKDGVKDMSKITWKDSLVIGAYQALSILPSISRSGATIAAGIFQGLDKKTALKFSFLLSIPAILGAIVLQISDMGSVSTGEIQAAVFGFIPALVFGFLSLKFLDKYVANKKFVGFAYYCVFLAVVSMFLNFK